MVRIDRRRAFPQNVDLGDDLGPGVLFKVTARQSNGGQDLTLATISEGLQLDLSCRAVTKLSDDRRYLNVVKLFPAD